MQNLFSQVYSKQQQQRVNNNKHEFCWAGQIIFYTKEREKRKEDIKKLTRKRSDLWEQRQSFSDPGTRRVQTLDNVHVAQRLLLFTGEFSTCSAQTPAPEHQVFLSSVSSSG